MGQLYEIKKVKQKGNTINFDYLLLGARNFVRVNYVMDNSRKPQANIHHFHLFTH